MKELALMGELNEVFGKGKVYAIDEKEYEVKPAMMGDLEDVGDIYNNKIFPNIAANFMLFKDEEEKTRKERISNLYKLLDKAFRGQCPKDKIKKLDILEVKEILDYFHSGVRA